MQELMELLRKEEAFNPKEDTLPIEEPQTEMYSEERLREGVGPIGGPNSPSHGMTAAEGLDLEDSALEGEFGILENEMGGQSTELSTTLEWNGLFANIPLLVQGQVDVEDLLAGEEATEEQVEIAKARAQEREKEGEVIPTYDTIEEAVAVAERRSDLKGQRRMKPIADSAPIIEEESIYPPGQAPPPEMPPPPPGKMPPAPPPGDIRRA
jgi:hypothetical protein